MKIKAETQVGIVVFTGLVALVLVYWFLGGLGLRATTYNIYAIFENAQKLQRGADVRMSGIKIGLVANTRLTEDAKARVDMLIENGVMIPKDSVARITTGSFIGEYYVEIEPGKSRKPLGRFAQIRTRSTVTPDELIEGANEALQTLEASLRKLNSLFAGEKLPGLIEDTVISLDKAAKSAANLVSSMQTVVDRMAPEIYQTVRNARSTTASAAEVGALVRDMVREDLRPKISTLLASSEALLKNLNTAVDSVQEVIKGYKSSGAALSGTLDKAQATLDTINEAAVQAKEMLTKLNEASSSIKELATDEGIKEDIRKTIRDISEVSGQLKQTVEAISRRLGPVVGPSPELVKRIPEYGFTVNALANTSRGQSRFDAYYTFLRDSNFYRIGGYDIGENTKLIAQGGSLLGQRMSLRYGIYASRIGVGSDYRFGQRGLLSADFYRPNDLQLEMRGTFKVRDWLRFYVGTNDLLDRENRDFIVGLQYRK